MKRLIFFILFIVGITTMAFSQGSFTKTPFNTVISEGLPDVSTSNLSFRGGWIGVGVNTILTGDGDVLKDKLNSNVNILYNIDFGGGWNIPVSGNLSLPINGEELKNIELGIFPWKVVSDKGGKVWVAHAGVSYNTEPSKKEGLESALQNFEAYAGAEVAIPVKNTALPLTASLTLNYKSLNLNRGSVFGLDLTPAAFIAPKLAIVGNVYAPFKKGSKPEVTLGMILNGVFGN